MRERTPDREALQVDLDRLSTLDTEALKRLWTGTGRLPLPKFMRRAMILRAVAHALQEDAIGGLDTATQKRLDQLVRLIVPAGERAPRPSLRIKPGTRFIREWQGRTYIVTAEPSGFLWDGKRYGSLSAIARAITGTRWNGRVFFGLKRPIASVPRSSRRRAASRPCDLTSQAAAASADG
jgi:hypothetical protein